MYYMKASKTRVILIVNYFDSLYTYINIFNQ